jgi:hypothetical protein
LESIDHIRQMMAEQKFSEAQRLIEAQLALDVSPRPALLPLYVDVLTALNKEVSDPLCLELAELELKNQNVDRARDLVLRIRSASFYTRVTEIRARIAEGKGLVDELYVLLSEFLVRQFAEQVPVVPVWHDELRLRFFRTEFNLLLKLLGPLLLRHDLDTAEASVRELLRSLRERPSHRGLAEKLDAVAQVLAVVPAKSPLELYRNYCLLAVHGIRERADYKRLVELVLAFDEFPLQVFLLKLLDELDLVAAAEEYAAAIRGTRDYSFVYLEKYFPRLKRYFVERAAATAAGAPAAALEAPDLRPAGEPPPEEFAEEASPEAPSDDEQKFFHLLKYQAFSGEELCDLAVSFLQLELPRVALLAARQSRERAVDDRGYLKASYLVLTCQLKLQDYRAAIDTGFDALGRSTSRDDLLSFMYGQAEAYLRLRQRDNARAVLTRIVAIDATYRLARERLEKLNEI